MTLARRLLSALAGGLLCATPLAAQTDIGTIAGRVVDAPSQQPLASANVVVVGTQRGTVTRDDGTFRLTVPAGTHTVRVTRIGYAPAERAVTVVAGETAQLEFALDAQAVVLSEVVTTGYGTQRREAITGSVATVDADDANVGVVTNANELMEGRVAGVQIVANNGEPGAGVQVRIRGGTSISASNEPLYVIDGVPINNASTEAGGFGIGGSPSLPRNPLNLINPNDIESITVLKDASATAIYGSRAANGVVLIETKKGVAGVSSLEYDTYVAYAAPTNYLDLLNGDEYRAFLQEQLAATPATDTAARRQWQERIDLQGTANTDWERAVIREAVTHNHNLAFSGGREDTRYRASLNYMDQQGIVLSSGLERVQGRLNANHNAFEDRLRLGLNLTASHVENDYVPFENTAGFEGAIFTNMLIMNPTYPVRLENDASGAPVFFEVGTGVQSVRNPVAIAEQIQDLANTTRALGNVQAEVDLFAGLTGQINVGADRSESLRRIYMPRANPIGAQWNGLAAQREKILTTKTLQTLLTYRNTILDEYNVDVVGGYEFNEYTTEEFGAEGRNFITDAFTWNNLGGGATLVQPYSWREDSRLVSFFGRANASFMDRLFVTGVLRYDGASQFGAGNKWALFPAISASYSFGGSEFLPSYVSDLRLRAGWGKQGNAAVRPYESLFLLGPAGKYVFGTTPVVAVTQTRNPNPNLKWEETDQYNVAVDFGLFQERWTGTLEYYVKNTRDLLLEVTVPQPAIVPWRLENIGRIKNSGVEFSLNAVPISTPTLNWQAGIVFAAERNEVVDLGDRDFITTGGVSGQGQSGQVSQRIMPGHPLGTFFGPVFVGVNPAGKQLFRCDRAEADCVGGQTVSPKADDYTVIGDANPDFSLGLRSQANWRSFDVSMLIRSEFGQDVFNNGALVYSTKGNALQNKNFLRAALDDPTGIREPAIYSSRWIEDGSYVRLQNLTVGYTLNVPVAGSIRPARVYLSGDNLFVITGYDGYDPEVHTDAGLASRGIDYLSYPRPRTFTAGVRVTY